jgi:SAM-dependent methyltransferase
VTTERTRIFFDDYAPDFDSIYGTCNNWLNRLVNRRLRRSMAIRYAKTIEGCTPIEGRTVLDVGCGPGHYAVALARRGAREVVGIDFAESMIQLARQKAEAAGVADRCRFVRGDFLAFAADRRFDYTVLMGFMDYVSDPGKTVRKAMELTSDKAFLSFPAAGGILAWQRRIRYRRRCDLYMYDLAGLKELFARLDCVAAEIERIERDFFVTATVLPGKCREPGQIS